MLNGLKNRFQSLTSPNSRKKPIPEFPEAGLYHYQNRTPGEQLRVHLRLDPDGHGTLLINANQIVHLNPTAALMAYLILEEISHEQALHTLVETYHVNRKQAAADLLGMEEDLSSILEGSGCLACSGPDVEIQAPFSVRPSAPYRMDLAVTYRCNNKCPHCYNARQRTFPELRSEDWYRIIDRLWELSIPHVVFTGGEPTLRDDLPDLIAYAEEKGQITGLNTNGRRLKDGAFLHTLLEAGLDHVQITFESHLPEIHNAMVQNPAAWDETRQGLVNVLDSRLFVMTNTTMLQDNYQAMEDTLLYLAELGVPTIGLNALIYAGRGENVGTGLSEAQLKPLLETAKQVTSRYNQRLIWYTPTQYCHFDPVELNLGVKGCSAALYNMCLEPNGDVLPCQSYYHPLGNILEDSWSSIWDHELAVEIRERKYIPDECKFCALLEECGGGCPLALKHHPIQPEQVLPLSGIGNSAYG